MQVLTKDKSTTNRFIFLRKNKEAGYFLLPKISISPIIFKIPISNFHIMINGKNISVKINLNIIIPPALNFNAKFLIPPYLSKNLVEKFEKRIFSNLDTILCKSAFIFNHKTLLW